MSFDKLAKAISGLMVKWAHCKLIIKIRFLSNGIRFIFVTIMRKWMQATLTFIVNEVRGITWEGQAWLKIFRRFGDYLLIVGEYYNTRHDHIATSIGNSVCHYISDERIVRNIRFLCLTFIRGVAGIQSLVVVTWEAGKIALLFLWLFLYQKRYFLIVYSTALFIYIYIYFPHWFDF